MLLEGSPADGVPGGSARRSISVSVSCSVRRDLEGDLEGDLGGGLGGYLGFGDLRRDLGGDLRRDLGADLGGGLWGDLGRRRVSNVRLKSLMFSMAPVLCAALCCCRRSSARLRTCGLGGPVNAS